MLVSIARVATVVASIATLVAPFAVPADPLRPRLPWAKDGLHDTAQKRDYPTSCNHGPKSRNCWSGGLSIDTDMDEHWPNTGVVRKVSHFLFDDSGSPTNINLQYHLDITNTTMAPDGFQRTTLVVNGQFPGPVSYSRHL